MSDSIEAPAPPHDSRAAGGRLHLLVRFLAFVFIGAFVGTGAVCLIALPVMVVMVVIADPWGMLLALGLFAGTAAVVLLLAWLWCAAWDVLVPRDKSNAKSEATPPKPR